MDGSDIITSKMSNNMRKDGKTSACMYAAHAQEKQDNKKSKKGTKSLPQPLVGADKLELRSGFWGVRESAAFLDGLPLLRDHPQGFVSIPGDP